MSIHIVRKLWQFQHCSWLFVHKRIMAFTSTRTAATQINTRYTCGNCPEESLAKWVMLHSTWDLGDEKVQRGGKIMIWIHLFCALSRWSFLQRGDSKWYMSKRDMFWAEDTFFSYLQIVFPCCLKEKTSRAMMDSSSTYLVSEILKVWCGPCALCNRWWVYVTQMGSNVSQLLCSRPYTENSLSLLPWSFISGCSTWDYCSVVRGAPVLCSCCRRKKSCQGYIVSTAGNCGPAHCPPKCRTEPGLASGAAKMWLLQWSCAVFSVWGVVSWSLSIWSDCKIFYHVGFLLRSVIQST